VLQIIIKQMLKRKSFRFSRVAVWSRRSFHC